ncbi:chemotaxis-specific protein-glutamate methyltransferase CheB [Halostella pelagica]|uniref:chemotaxis-specific protein-glutamate methyltransferase CheB n=1 Tax=Halostella pelagica TaxID=2583824 RepID=UPI00108151CD|nr:chemotaxis-specific protein-glutamate methyltransferase CheB [Halostella pelagica]
MTSVLVVDDSQFMRTVIGNILSKHGYEVHRAADGETAVDAVEEHDPDLVTMDVEMPGMDGIEAVDCIMSSNPTRILMLSAHTDDGADATFEALSKGAVDFMAKAGDGTKTDIAELEERLIEALDAVERADISSVIAQRLSSRTAAMSGRETTNDDATTAEAATADAVSAEAAAAETASTGTASTGSTERKAPTDTTTETAATGPTTTDSAGGPTISTTEPANADRVTTSGDRIAPEYPTIVVGASTGGPKIVERILYELPADLKARVLVVQHMPASFTDRLAARLDPLSAYDVREATHGTRVGPGEAVIAKGEYHMRVAEEDGDELRLRLTRSDRRHGVRPAIDVTMESAANAVTTPLVGVALTGMGSDGAAGIEAIQQAGGKTIAQDEASSPVFGIPQQAIKTGCVDSVLGADDISQGIVDAATAESDTDG